jgi:4-amino-4-deoxy-L-arabinose transferase-like glycosyltransferase
MPRRFDITSQTFAIRAIFCFAAVLWLCNLGADSLWLDEAVSVQRANYGFGELLDTVYGVGTNPPLHYILLFGWIRVFGNSEFSVRLPSALCALASLVLTYRIALRMFDKRVATLAVLVTSLSAYQLYFAQEARTYALFSILGLLSIYYLYRLLTETRYRLVAGYVVSSSLMLWSHPYAPFIIIMQNVFVVLMWLVRSEQMRLGWKKWVAMQAAVGVSFLPWLWTMLGKIAAIQSRPFSLKRPYWVDIPGVFKAQAGDSAVLGLFMILLATLAVVSVVRRVRVKSVEFRNVLFLGLWIAVPIIVPFAVSRVSSSIFSSRYQVVSCYAFYILVAAGVCCIRYRVFRWIGIGVLLAGFVVTLVGHSLRVDREPWREVVGRIEAEAGPGEPVVFYARYCRTPYEYYAVREDMPRLGVPFKGDSMTVDGAALEELGERLAGYERIWVVFSHSLKNEAKIREYLTESWEMEDEQQYFGVQILRLVHK